MIKQRKAYNQNVNFKFSNVSATFAILLELILKFYKYYRQNLYFVKAYFNLINFKSRYLIFANRNLKISDFLTNIHHSRYFR